MLDYSKLKMPAKLAGIFKFWLWSTTSKLMQNSGLNRAINFL